MYIYTYPEYTAELRIEIDGMMRGALSEISGSYIVDT